MGSYISRTEALSRQEARKRHEENALQHRERLQNWQNHITWNEHFQCNMLIREFNEDLVRSPDKPTYEISAGLRPTELEYACLRYQLAYKGWVLGPIEVDHCLQIHWSEDDDAIYRMKVESQ